MTEILALFLIIAIGIFFGRIKIKGISLDLSAVIFVALVFGHYGVQISSVFQVLGLLLFVYAIGVQAGPGFFEAFKDNGLKYVFLAVILVLVATLTTAGIVIFTGTDRNLTVGLLTGALTSTPGLAAAIEASSKPELASIGYGIAYPFGVIGVILFVHIIPLVFRINIKNEERKYDEELISHHPEILHSHLIVTNKNIMDKTIGKLKIRSMTGATVTRIHFDGETERPTKKSVLKKGALIRMIGTKEALEKAKLLIGPVTTQDIPVKKSSEVEHFLVTNKDIVNKTLAQLNLLETFGVTVTRIRRSGIDFLATPNSMIRFGDKLQIICTGNKVAVAKLLGNEDKKLLQTDFLSIAIGLVMGILLGTLAWPLTEGLELKLGLTGGVLISSMVLSRLGKLGPIIWNISGPANQFMKQLGLLLFLAAVGTKSGVHLMETISENGIQLFVYGTILTLTPMFVATIIGRFVLKINFISLLGVLTGGMTSTPGLTAVESISESNAASIAYATVYPVTMVLLMIVAQVLCLI